MKKIFAIAAVAAAVLVSCKKDDNNNKTPGISDEPGDVVDSKLPESLKGSEYYIISLDEASTAALGDRVVANIGVDDTNVFLYIWENTYAGGVCSGVNFYDEASEWISLSVGTVGWSGCGWCAVNASQIAGIDKMYKNISAKPGDYYLHLAYKSNQNAGHQIQFIWNDGAEQVYKFTIGGTAYEGIAPTAPVDGEFVQGDWNEYEIKLSTMGLDFSRVPWRDGANYLVALSGGEAGTTLDLDAMFIYKK